MIVPRPQDTFHKNHMYRLLRAILTDEVMALRMQFKGGTYAAMRGVLDRFSVDLDFDLPDISIKGQIRKRCYEVFKDLDLTIKDESKQQLQFFLRYETKDQVRNTLKLEINDQPSLYNLYEKVYLPEIGMYSSGHTLDTMFANKLVAALGRFQKTGKIAGRDFYDIHSFMLQGLTVNIPVVEERTGKHYTVYLNELVSFVETKVTEKSLNEDLNLLLEKAKLPNIVKNLKQELIGLIKDEIARHT